MNHSHSVALAETITTYDAVARRYAVRFAVTDLAGLRERFSTIAAEVGGAVLDAGCGPGLDCRRFEQADASPIGLDLSPGMLREAAGRTGAPLVRSDLRVLPLRGSAVAGVWGCASLVHLDLHGARAALAEFRRVLLPGGALFVSVCIGAGSEWQGGPSGHRRWFQHHDEREFIALVTAARFVVSTTERKDAHDSSWLNLLARRP